MSTVIVAVVLVAFVAGFCLLFHFIHQKQKRRHMNQLLNRFSEFVASRGFSISSQAVLHNTVIGLDGVHRIFIILRYKEEKNVHLQVVHLDEVQACTVRKTYGTIPGGGLANRPLEQYLQSVVLCFTFNTEKLPVEVSFYHHAADLLTQLGTLEQKARDWEAVLTKMLGKRLKTVA